MNIFFTIISGVVVFTLGQIIQEFVLRPIQRYKETVGEIDHSLKYYANVICNQFDQRQYIELVYPMSEAMRLLSCKLESNYKQIPFKRIFSAIKVVPNENKLYEAGSKLIFISNFSGKKQDWGIQESANALFYIRKILCIPTPGSITEPIKIPNQ